MGKRLQIRFEQSPIANYHIVALLAIRGWTQIPQMNADFCFYPRNPPNLRPIFCAC
jgi:hypothetical protein